MNPSSHHDRFFLLSPLRFIISIPFRRHCPPILLRKFYDVDIVPYSPFPPLSCFAISLSRVSDVVTRNHAAQQLRDKNL